MFKKTESEDKTKFESIYPSSKAEIIIDESDIDDVFQLIYTTIMIKHTKTFRKRFRLDY